ncbi:hypothetical protein ACWFMH_19260, partial [Bacillus altitudinis]
VRESAAGSPSPPPQALRPQPPQAPGCHSSRPSASATRRESGAAQSLKCWWSWGALGAGLSGSTDPLPAGWQDLGWLGTTAG